MPTVQYYIEQSTNTFTTNQLVQTIHESEELGKWGKSKKVYVQLRGQEDKIYPIGALSSDNKIFVITIYADEAIDREKFKLFPYPEK